MPGKGPPHGLSPPTGCDIHVDDETAGRGGILWLAEEGCHLECLSPNSPKTDSVTRRTFWSLGRRRGTLAFRRRLLWPIGKRNEGRIRGPKAKKKAAYFIWHCVECSLPFRFDVC